jgi:hypothetical protein
MYNKHKSNVTMIEDLEDLEDLEDNDKYKKFIRNSRGIPMSESGMKPGSHYDSHYDMKPDSHYDSHYDMKPDSHYDMKTNHEHINVNSSNDKVYNMSNDSPSCLKIHEHVLSCPICSTFFKPNITLYVIAIILLSVICILLLKKVLNL